jgi:hypothetical protein
MANINFLSLNEAICYWLGYQFRIGRQNLMHEASLRYPIADSLTSMGFPINKIVLEKQHPFFIQRYVDVTITKKQFDLIDDLEFAIETDSIFELKLSSEKTGKKNQVEHQRVLNDILRLAYFNLWSKKNAYFVMCGQYGDFKNYFIGQLDEQPKDFNQVIKLNEKSRENIYSNQNEWNSEKSIYKDIFNFGIQRLNNSKKKESKSYTFTKTQNNSSEPKFGFETFISDYKKRTNYDYGNGIKIKTTCLSITPFELIPSRTHACGIWKIEGIKTI